MDGPLDSGTGRTLQQTHIQLTHHMGRSHQAEVLANPEAAHKAPSDDRSGHIGLPLHRTARADLQHFLGVEPPHKGAVDTNAPLEGEIAFVTGVSGK